MTWVQWTFNKDSSLTILSFILHFFFPLFVFFSFDADQLAKKIIQQSTLNIVTKWISRHQLSLDNLRSLKLRKKSECFSFGRKTAHVRKNFSSPTIKNFGFFFCILQPTSRCFYTPHLNYLWYLSWYTNLYENPVFYRPLRNPTRFLQILLTQRNFVLATCWTQYMFHWNCCSTQATRYNRKFKF